MTDTQSYKQTYTQAVRNTAQLCRERNNNSIRTARRSELRRTKLDARCDELPTVKVIVRSQSTVEHTSIASVFRSRQWSD